MKVLLARHSNPIAKCIADYPRDGAVMRCEAVSHRCPQCETLYCDLCAAMGKYFCTLCMTPEEEAKNR